VFEGGGLSFLLQLVKNNVVRQSIVARISLFIVLNLILKIVKVFWALEAL